MQRFPRAHIDKINYLSCVLQVCKFSVSGTPTAVVPTKACSVEGARMLMGNIVPSGLVEANIVDQWRKVRRVSIAIGPANLVADLGIGSAIPVIGAISRVSSATSLVIGETSLAMSLAIAATSLVTGVTAPAGHVVVVMTRVWEEVARTIKTVIRPKARTSKPPKYR